MRTNTFSITTHDKREVVDITDIVGAAVRTVEGDGLVTIFVAHTTAGIATADLDPGGTEDDYMHVFKQLIPEPPNGFKHPHDPSHMPDHILSTIIGTSLTVPVKDGRLLLGTWQKIVFLEFDGPRERNVVVSRIE